MECPVCYSAEAKLTTRCGHTFCFDCVKRWLVASDEEDSPTCPMCRTTLHFKGIQKIQHALAEERYERKCSEVMDDLIQETFGDMQYSIELLPSLKRVFERSAVAVLKDREETVRVLKEIDGAYAEDMFEAVDSGLILKMKNEMRAMRRQQWKQRDRFAGKNERTRVMTRHR
jgi:hypothetical protein